MADAKKVSFGAAQIGESPISELTSRPVGAVKYRKAHGDRLKTPKAQKDWTVSNDGAGLLTAQIVFGLDHSAVESAFTVGMAFSKLPRLYLNKAESTFGSSGFAKVQTEWVGIVEGQDRTDIKTETSSNVGAEPIETHPDFKSKLAGTEFEPKNGARFEKGMFKAFSIPYGPLPGTSTSTNDNIRLTGVKSYYEPSVTIRGHFYTVKVTGPGNDLELGQRISYISDDGKFMGIQLVPIREVKGFQGEIEAGVAYRNFLLTSVAFEEYAAGNVYKVTYEVQLSGFRGWNRLLYFHENPALNLRPKFSLG